jgi:hypothetical protein
MSSRNPAEAYSALRVPLDRLPYTKEMDGLVESLNQTQANAKTHHDVWSELVDLRKRGLLPKVGRHPTSAKK